MTPSPLNVHLDRYEGPLDPLLDLTADVILHPSFPQEELDKWKQRKLTSFQQQRTQHTFLGSERLAHVLYQKLGNDWYAFTEVDGDCFMTKVDAEMASTAQKKVVEESEVDHFQRKRRAA